MKFKNLRKKIYFKLILPDGHPNVTYSCGVHSMIEPNVDADADVHVLDVNDVINYLNFASGVLLGHMRSDSMKVVVEVSDAYYFHHNFPSSSHYWRNVNAVQIAIAVTTMVPLDINYDVN